MAPSVVVIPRILLESNAPGAILSLWLVNMNLASTCVILLVQTILDIAARAVTQAPHVVKHVFIAVASFVRAVMVSSTSEGSTQAKILALSVEALLTVLVTFPFRSRSEALSVLLTELGVNEMFQTLLFPLLPACLVHLPVGLIKCFVKGFLEALLSSSNRVNLFVGCIPTQYHQRMVLGIWNILSQTRRAEILTSLELPLQGIVSCISRHTQKGAILCSLLRVRRLRALMFRRIAKDYTGGTRQERVYLRNLFYSVNIASHSRLARGIDSIPTRHTGVGGGPNRRSVDVEIELVKRVKIADILLIHYLRKLIPMSIQKYSPTLYLSLLRDQLAKITLRSHTPPHMKKLLALIEHVAPELDTLDLTSVREKLVNGAQKRKWPLCFILAPHLDSIPDSCGGCGLTDEGSKKPFNFVVTSRKSAFYSTVDGNWPATVYSLRCRKCASTISVSHSTNLTPTQATGPVATVVKSVQRPKVTTGVFGAENKSSYLDVRILQERHLR